MLELGAIYDEYIFLGFERQPRKSGGTRIVYSFECPECKDNEVRIRKGEWESGIRRKCYSCTAKKRPFESIYNTLIRYRDDNALTYEEFLEFTEIKNCVYCDAMINWQPYRQNNREYISSAYYLDRKNNDIGYAKENCVVCCSECNKIKLDKFTYDEFILLSSGLKKIRQAREEAVRLNAALDGDYPTWWSPTRGGAQYAV